MKKLKTFQIVLILIFILFLIFLFIPKNYQKEYVVNNIKVMESYSKDNDSYYFTFNYNNIALDYLIEQGYKQHRSLIKEIEIVEDEDNFCLIPSGSNLPFVPLCYENGTLVHYSKVSNSLKSKLPNELFLKANKIETYNDIDIYNKDYTYLIWNYNGFYYLSEKENKKINIFDKELYTVNLIGYTKDFITIADYDSNYTFNKFYTIDFKKGNLKEYNLDYNVYFDSYFIGHEKNKLYIVDNKENMMYEFNAKNGKLDKTKSKVLKNGEWENVNIKTIINKKQEFDYKTNFNYTLDGQNLYLNYKGKDSKTLIANEVTSVTRINNEDIFYLKKEALYHFNPKKGEELLLTYFELNFNYENILYVN